MKENMFPFVRLQNCFLQRFLTDTEFNQSIVRILISLCAGLYVGAVRLGQTDSDVGFVPISLLAFSIYYLLVSVAIVIAIYTRPGHVRVRRLLMIFHDYSGVTVLMTFGGPSALPVYAVIVWITVGNGLRFGARYLIIAAFASLISLLFLIAFNPYLQMNPTLSSTLVITGLIVPGYAYVLLTRLRKAAVAAEQANSEKSLFLAQASHDLRQPIHAIGLFVAQLRETTLSKEQAEMVGKIDQSIHGAGQLFKSLLDVSMLESGGLIPNFQSVHLGTLFAELERQNELSAQWAKVTIRFMTPRNSVRADPAFLATMLQNLIANALKYAPGSRILVGCRMNSGRLTIGVYDNGPGIAAADLPHVTSRFYRTRSALASNMSGMGLGLSIVERLAGLLNLKISIKSKLGCGVSALIEGFVVTVDTPSVEQINRLYPQQMQGLSILLLEDDQDTLDVTTSLLEKWGCQISAHTAPPAVIPDCDIIISDYEFGGTNTLIQHLPRLKQKNVPLIVVTGTDAAVVRTALGASDVVVLTKPMRPAELRSLLMAQRARIRART
jgi:signal transduction histidine kinase/CheY-like chemotaxis protein